MANTMSETKTAAQAIEQAIKRSITHTEIEPLNWSQDLEDELLTKADGCFDDKASGIYEFWSGEKDAAEWRVHLIRER
jgi:hypothetical protein